MADACRADTGNVRALWQHAAEEMSRCGAAIRDPAQIRAYGKQVEAQLADFAQTVKAGSRTELAMLYRLRDMLLSQRAYLTAMTDYTAHGGKSRGSALHTDLTGGVKPFGQLPDTFTFALDETENPRRYAPTENRWKRSLPTLPKRLRRAAAPSLPCSTACEICC